MLDPIPIPSDVVTYLKVTVILLGLSGSTVASRLSESWFKRGGLTFHQVYAGVLFITASLAMLVFDFRPLAGSIEVHIVSIFLGILGGLVAFWADREISRRFQRRFAARRQPQRVRAEVRFYQTARQRATQEYSNLPANHGSFGASELALAGALEEVVFRGVFVTIAFSEWGLPGWHTATTVGWLTLSTLAFLLAHLHFGWSQVINKLPITAITLTGVLVTDCLTIAVISHVTFNLAAYLILQRHEKTLSGFRNTFRGEQRRLL